MDFGMSCNTVALNICGKSEQLPRFAGCVGISECQYAVMMWHDPTDAYVMTNLMPRMANTKVLRG
jgi:hypothetical protein